VYALNTFFFTSHCFCCFIPGTFGKYSPDFRNAGGFMTVGNRENEERFFAHRAFLYIRLFESRFNLLEGWWPNRKNLPRVVLYYSKLILYIRPRKFSNTNTNLVNDNVIRYVYIWRTARVALPTVKQSH